MGRNLKYDPELVKRVCEESGSMMAAARRLNLHFNTFKRIAEEVGCYSPNKFCRSSYYVQHKYTKEDIEQEFLSNKRTIQSAALRGLLIREGIKSSFCEHCGRAEWLGKPITLELHHKDGNKYNNHLDNLAVLCPNCHAWETDGNNSALSQNKKGKLEDTGYRSDEERRSFYSSYRTNDDHCRVERKVRNPVVSLTCSVCGRSFVARGHEAPHRRYCSYSCSAKASEKFSVTRDELLDSFKVCPNYTRVGRSFGVTANAVKKRCKRLGIYEEVDKLIELEKVNRGMRATPNIHTKESARKGVESRLAHLDDYVCYRLDGFEFIEVCRYKSKRELEEAGYKTDIVNRACRGAIKTYRGLYWRREKKVSSDKAS